MKFWTSKIFFGEEGHQWRPPQINGGEFRVKVFSNQAETCFKWKRVKNYIGIFFGPYCKICWKLYLYAVDLYFPKCLKICFYFVVAYLSFLNFSSIKRQQNRSISLNILEIAFEMFRYKNFNKYVNEKVK